MFRYVADEFNKLFKRSPDAIARERRLSNTNTNTNGSILLHNKNRHKSTLTSTDLNNNNILDSSRVRTINSALRESFSATFDPAAEEDKKAGESLIPVNKNAAKYFRAYDQNKSDFDQLDWFGQFKPSDLESHNR